MSDKGRNEIHNSCRANFQSILSTNAKVMKGVKKSKNILFEYLTIWAAHIKFFYH